MNNLNHHRLAAVPDDGDPATAATARWSHPTNPTDVELAFPARPVMPSIEEIPTDYSTRAHWTEFQKRWFFGPADGLQVEAKTGVDLTVAMRHLGTIQGSFTPSHEHKEAAVAWLASLWLADWSDISATASR